MSEKRCNLEYQSEAATLLFATLVTGYWICADYAYLCILKPIPLLHTVIIYMWTGGSVSLWQSYILLSVII